MAEPQPSTVTSGSTLLEEPENPTNVPSSAEDRKAAAALSALDVRGDDDAAPKTSGADHAALSAATNKLGATSAVKGQESASKKVKVEAGDVALLVSENRGEEGWESAVGGVLRGEGGAEGANVSYK